MALLYRAVWQDRRTDLVGAVDEAFLSWVTEKESRGQRPLPWNWEPVEGERIKAAIGTLVEERPNEEWRTTLRVVEDVTPGEQWLCVDVERTADDPYQLPEIAAPRLVVDLLERGREQGGHPRVGPTLLSGRASIGVSDPKEVSATLAPLIRDPNRTTPLVFFSHDHDEHPGATALRAESAAKRVAGIATVYVLTTEAQSAFNAEMGLGLGVWGGAARMYLPGTLDPYRHRYLRREFVQSRNDAAAFQFSQMLRTFSPTTRLPDRWSTIDALIATERKQPLQEQIDNLVRQRDELQLEHDRSHDLYLDARSDQQSAQEDAESLRIRVRTLMAQVGHGPDTEDQWVWPSTVSSFTDLVDTAKKYLNRLAIPIDASQGLSDLDNALEGDVWAQSAWTGLRALQEYAERPDDFSGGFWEWCEHGDPVYRWPASQKKLAMSESDTTTSDARLAAKRHFPVDIRMEASGKIDMASHLKVAEGGGGNIPRIYFLDDTRGTTQMIHIGFIGPHAHVPNRSKS